MARAGVSPLRSIDSTGLRVERLEAAVRELDPASRALLDLSLRRQLRDDDMAPVLRIDAFNLAWRRARVLERLASGLGLADPAGLAQVRAALPHLPAGAWCVPLALEPGPPVEGAATVEEPMTVEGSAETMEFDAIVIEPEPESAPEHSFGPRALAVRSGSTRPVPAPPAPVAPRLRAALARRPATARGALLAGAGAVLGALLSRRRR